MAPRPARTLVLAAIALLLAACGRDDPAAPGPGMRRAIEVGDGDGPAQRLVLRDGEASVGPVARVEIVPAAAFILYESPTQVVAREFTAVAYDAQGNVVTGRAVTWRDETNWHPGVTPVRLSPTTARVALPYANAAAPTLTPSATCVLDWKGIAATIDGVTALAPVCGTFGVIVSAEPGGFVPVAGDTIRLGAFQLCHVRARATGGYGTYDYRWTLDGRDVGGGPTMGFMTGERNATHTLVLRVSDEGHDINPYRELRFTVRIDGEDDANYDC